MSADPDRALLATSLAFAGAAVLGSAVAIREDLPGQPCGISIPLSVPAGLLVGWGAGVAAPWPMPAAAVIAAARSQRTRPHALTGAVCAGIGICCVLGTVIEPVTRRPRSSSPATRLAIASNIAASAALTVTGLRHRAAARALRLRTTQTSRALTASSAWRRDHGPAPQPNLNPRTSPRAARRPLHTPPTDLRLPDQNSLSPAGNQ
jgi:drug/metabolite transporter (DMT)-like permease